MMNSVFRMLSVAFFSVSLAFGEAAPKGLIASVRLYNPTPSSDWCLVEIPVGRLATPDLVDWGNMRLLHHGQDLPFGLREGKAHWKSALAAPITRPSAEDLLVFQIRIPSAQWSEVQLVKGRAEARPALTWRDGSLEVSYPDFKVVVAERSGLLTGLEAYGERLLSRPMGAQVFTVGEGVVNYAGGVGPGYNRSAVAVKKQNELGPPKVELVSWSSTAAMTELNFVLASEKGPAVGLSYRIYSHHQLEIVADERPWRGHSPWLDYGMEYDLRLTGTAEALPGWQTHFPYYGFKDYPASVKSTGLVYRGNQTLMFELGEESRNGRFWRRRLAVYPEREWAQRDDRLHLLCEGLVVDVSPLYSQPLAARAQVAFAGEMHAAGNLVLEKLRQAGIQATPAPDAARKPAIVLRQVSDPTRLGITGDGFCVRPLPKQQGVEVAAGTKFGLFKGACALAQELDRTGKSVRAPLIAQNPVVDLRAGGFGGGNHEVDFPYGTPAEWEEVLGNLAVSGMNKMTCLGMWSNWKMPVYFKYMPELYTGAAGEHDEVSGTPFSQTTQHREHALRLITFLHDRGVKVWLWIPVGAIPTTFQKKFPEAMVPGSTKVPRFMHPKYREYVEAYFKELLEAYPVDGMVLIRDDNGGVDTSEEFKSFVAQSPTKSPVWEQHRLLYSRLRSLGFKGDIAVYPYFDPYEPRLETLLPADLLIVGHGCGLGELTRNIELVGPMGDTWLDNQYMGFRLPPSGRMKRLLADRASYWIGGAYCGTELPWEAVGYFGWEPTASVNTFRYEFGERNFGKEKALPFVEFSDAYERLWETMADSLLPYNWLMLTNGDRAKSVTAGRAWLTAYRQRLDRLQAGAEQKSREKWFAHVDAWDTYFGYHLRRVEVFGQMQDLIASNRLDGASDGPLPEPVRQQLIALHEETYKLARGFEERAARIPGDMMAATRAAKITAPFKEILAGYDRSLEYAPALKVKQFDGALKVVPPRLTPGQPFELEVELQHRGCIPWMAGIGNDLMLKGETRRLCLPERWTFEGAPMVFGDRRVIKLRGVAPEQPGQARIQVDFLTSFRDWVAFSQALELKWP